MREAKEAMEKGYIVEVQGESAEAESDSKGEPTDGNNGGELPDGGESDDYEVPHLKLVDPRERSGKVQQ
jgi:hypothetical protein